MPGGIRIAYPEYDTRDVNIYVYLLREYRLYTKSIICVTRAEHCVYRRKVMYICVYLLRNT